MQRIILPWSQAHTPGINAEVVIDEVPTTDPIITVPHAAVAEIRAIFTAFCASLQQGDRNACELLRPLFAAYDIVPTVSL